ncbi:MAG TPA: hypothetical protein VNI54_10835 [Thermoanaerobaculia bacterium]|nr:hypothetical protein [Thermoanaerobaculia bacterium]
MIDPGEAEIRLAALCDHALVAQDGKLSVMGIFRNISVSDLPAQHPRMFVVAVLMLDQGAHEVSVHLRDPQGRPAMPHPPEMTVHSSGTTQDVNVIVELNNMSFAAYGQYRFDLHVDGRTVGSLPVTITQMASKTPGGPRPN